NGGCGKYCLGRRGRYQQRQPVVVRDFLKPKCLVRRRTGDCEAAPLLSAEIARLPPTSSDKPVGSSLVSLDVLAATLVVAARQEFIELRLGGSDNLVLQQLYQPVY